MTLIKSCDIHNTVYYKTCRECLHDLAKAEKAEQKASKKNAKLIDQQRLKSILPRQKPKQVSDKQKEKNEAYNARVKVWKVENPECKAKCNEYCTEKTNDAHHQIGRGIHLMDEKYWLACCRNCHIYITNHPKESMDKGWSFSRLENLYQEQATI